MTEFDDAYGQGVAEGSTNKDMTGQTCEKCKKGKYQERSQHDDMQGKVTCKCGHRVDRWKKYKEQGVSEGSEQNIPPVLYHATFNPRLKSIKLKGLGASGKRNWSDSKSGVVYLALDPNVAESYAETALDDLDADWDIIILKISTRGLNINKFQLDRNVLDNEGDTLEYHGIIPPSNITMYKQGVAEG